MITDEGWKAVARMIAWAGCDDYIAKPKRQETKNFSELKSAINKLHEKHNLPNDFFEQIQKAVKKANKNHMRLR